MSRDHEEEQEHRQHYLPKILRHPITLQQLSSDEVASRFNANGYYDFAVGDGTPKNALEQHHFAQHYTPGSPAEKSYANRLRYISHPDVLPTDVVVDLGCGPYPNIQSLGGQSLLVDDLMGYYTTELGFDQVTGDKISARAESMPLADDSVDVLYSINMLDHVDDMPDATLEMARVLKKAGGTLVLQCYYNSFPLLHTEPGIFDEYFYKEVFTKIYEPLEVATFAVGDPRISASYNCDIIAGRFRVRPDWETQLGLRNPRQVYGNPQHVGVQGHIAHALVALDENRYETALGHIQALEAIDRIGYREHAMLLRMRYYILVDELGRANMIGKEIRNSPRLRRNVRLLLTLERLENRRITRAATGR